MLRGGWGGTTTQDRSLAKHLRRGWSDARERITARLILDVLSMPEKELSTLLSRVEELVESRGELAVFYLRALAGVARKWLDWEDKCREQGCPGELPEEARMYGVAAYYSTSIKETIIIALEDIGLPWAIPSWAVWFARRIKRPLTRLYGLSIDEHVARLIIYPVFVYALRSISYSLLRFYEEKGSGYAAVTAGFLYWDVVMPMYEAASRAVNPVKHVMVEGLEAASSIGGAGDVGSGFVRALVAAKNGLLRAIIRERLDGLV